MDLDKLVLKKTIAILVLFTVVASTLYVLSLAKQLRLGLPTPKEPSEQQEDQKALLDELGLVDTWVLFDETAEALLESWQPDSAKIIFEFKNNSGQRYYLADLKKAAGKKNQRWEFPGGRVDKGERVLDALERELNEEDPSGTLAKVLRNSRTASSPILYYKNIELRKGNHESLFKAKISEEEWQELKDYWRRTPHPRHKEIYDFVMLPADQLDTRISDTKRNWTPKSRRILRALRETNEAS